jgi:hypothetical protein
MKPGDTVIVTADTEDNGCQGVVRGDASIAIGRRVYEYWIVTFSDGHEGAYEERELRVVEASRG